MYDLDIYMQKLS